MKRNNIVNFPYNKKINQSHSKKLEWALKDFIKSIGYAYYEDEIENGIIALYSKLNNGICVEQKIHIGIEDYVCYTNLSCFVSPKNKSAISHCKSVANAINTELNYGNFEILEDTGEIRYRTYYAPGDILYLESLDQLLGYPLHIINLYGTRFSTISNNSSL